MTAADFRDYALSSNLTPDETYTVELLIERVRKNFDPTYWDDWDERGDARLKPNYKPRFSAEHVAPAAEELKSLTWLSFQRLSDAERPVRALGAIRFLPQLSELVLINNDISDLTPLSECPQLRQLHLVKNPLRDISPLAESPSIEVLHLENCPVADFSALEVLPNLRELSISTDQIPAFKRLKRLPHLRKLKLGLEAFDSFEGFPEMPELRVIWNAEVKKLDGLQQFTKLQNLANLRGLFNSLEPLRSLKGLTRTNIIRSRVASLEPLTGLPAVREFHISTDSRKVDLSPLKSLPSLHEVNVRCNGVAAPGLDKLRASLSSWDFEFRASAPRHQPSLKLDIVDQQTFDVYDKQRPYNVDLLEKNEGLLESELHWLDEQLKDFLAADFRANEDFVIPFGWNGARSRTVVLRSDRTVSDFKRLVLGIQQILSHAKEDWIIYLQINDVEPEFIVWLYPDKIMVAEKFADTLRTITE